MRPHHGCEIVLELAASVGTEVGGHEEAARALRSLPGVREVHVDRHLRWAMVCYDPEQATVAVITGCLAAHGLTPSRARPLVTDSDTCE